ncbi:MAG: twin-arginine translocation pathway signal protein [Betaproteobacteria bacterium HGW-Betaproteobacteria-3]|jgi:tripartite-type tricarboxylate transporter receptor subunit TctC|nr:MAG: twin-arginine translocation pathway signal protein [Betaproteobacteria bacterium HGW-Betaproteobacteria-3]
MPISRRQILQSASAAALLGSTARLAWAQGQPLETAKFVTGFSAGGTSDTLCRRVASRLSTAYAKTAVVENKTGAGGQIAVQAVKGAAPDGATILQTPMSMLGVYPHIYRKLPYDPLADLTPASLACTFDFGFAVGPAVPSSIQTVPEFLAWSKANPNLANFGSPAAGSVPHFIGVLLGRSAGVDIKHAAYRGTQPAILDMIGGQIPAVSGPVGEFTQHVATGKARLLGTSGAKRSKFAPTVPTFAEQGLKDMVFSEWMGFYLPAKAPPDVVQRLNAALRAALASADVVDGLAAMGLEAASSSPAELAALLKSDTERWGPLVKSIGFTADA